MDFYSFNNMGQGFNRYGAQNDNGNCTEGNNANYGNGNNGYDRNNAGNDCGGAGNFGYNGNNGGYGNGNAGYNGNANCNNNGYNCNNGNNFQNKFNEYSSMSEKQLYAELANVVDRMKRDGSFDIGALENLYATSSPFLNEAQRERMKGIIDMLKSQ